MHRRDHQPWVSCLLWDHQNPRWGTHAGETAHVNAFTRHLQTYLVTSWRHLAATSQQYKRRIPANMPYALLNVPLNHNGNYAYHHLMYTRQHNTVLHYNMFRLIFRMCSVRISAGTHAILTENFRDFPQYLL
jgi:hypothetical protein